MAIGARCVLKKIGCGVFFAGFDCKKTPHSPPYVEMLRLKIFPIAKFYQDIA
jgi:hypothetical protein